MTNKIQKPAIVGKAINSLGKARKSIPMPKPTPTIVERKYTGESDRSTLELQEMLTYRRMSGTKTARRFNRRFIEPLFGKPDGNGNYILHVGDNPRVAFMAHHDSVHYQKGIQRVAITDGFIHLDKDESYSSCLGADCATGVWLILEMIRNNVPGVYIIHADEESGCKGSRALVKSNPHWINGIDAAISFDRKGTNSVITFQSSYRTCSDLFAESLSDILGLGMESDTGGSYTDSNEYVDVIGECTNLSVGYYSQHTKNESQDLQFAALLADRLIGANWGRLVISRNPGDVESLYPASGRYGAIYEPNSWSRNWRGDSYWGDFEETESDSDLLDAGRYEKSSDPYGDLIEILERHPESVADILSQMGYDAASLAREIAESYFGPKQ